MSQVYGRGAVRRPGGKIVYHLGDRLLVDGEERTLDDDEITWMAEPQDCPRAVGHGHAMQGHRPGSPTVSLADAYGREAVTRLDGVGNRRWGAWSGGPISRSLLRLGQGKSWLLREVVSALMGPLLQRIADASPAALARMTAHASLPFSFDEAEPSAQWVLELLSLMRISSGGEGLRVRVDMQTGGVQVQAPRFSALLSNVSSPNMSRADASRVVTINLGDEVEDWPAVDEAITGAMAQAAGVRSRIIRDAAMIAAKVKSKSRELQSLGMDSREALASGALTACWQWWGIDDMDVSQHRRSRPR